MRLGKRPLVGPALFQLLVVLLGAPASAQIPETFTNLKVIDQQTECGALVGVMRGWAGSLGVRCNHCHVGPDDLVGIFEFLSPGYLKPGMPMHQIAKHAGDFILRRTKQEVLS